MYFRNGDKYSQRGRLFIMEHASSRGKVTAGEMWEFLTKFITRNDMGMINYYLEKKTISVRLKRLINRVRRHMAHILVDLPAEWHRLDDRIIKELAHMAKIKLLDINAYRDTVNKSKLRKSAKPAAVVSGQTLKSLARSRKRKLCRAMKQNDFLRNKVILICLFILVRELAPPLFAS